MAEEEVTPIDRKHGHHQDNIAEKIEHKTETLQAKAKNMKPQKDEQDKKPKGGFDDTPIPYAPPGYNVKITFHRANALPFADINSLSSDPYVLTQLYTKLPTRHKQDPNLFFRTTTIRRNVDPVWNEEWIVANVPSSGFALKARIYDEDPADHDDRLGNVSLNIGGISESWEGIKEQAFKVKKRMGSKRAYFVRGCAAMFNRNVKMSGDLVMSVEVLGRTQSDNGGHMYTIGPCTWSKHFSPMIGRLAGTKEPGHSGTDKYNFQSNQMQLAGPVPPELYHRYVEFKPFVAGMFTSTSLKGRLLNRALHHQHARIYNYDRTTIYGSFPAPSPDLTLQLLDLCHWDKGGRIFTYVITLDGQWRFTETGKEFGIDMLSKHTMHSDVNIYIAYSGEFFIRRLKHPHSSGSPDEQPTHPPVEIDNGPPSGEPPKDPAYYSLIIDNDSGTYRPNAKKLPQLKEFLQTSLPGLKVVTLDCQADEEKMGRWKQEQRDRKKAEGSGQVLIQGDDSSISSSEYSDLDEQERLATGQQKISKKKKMEMKLHLKNQAEAKGEEPPQEAMDGQPLGKEATQQILDEKSNGHPSGPSGSGMKQETVPNAVDINNEKVERQ
ncbi:uncharacterized protein KY384_009153 [Bacidia gigantensis]|uniref:uncharacterized protein n=1 Tax=Bacidia gigantensis TaxID=2732470 RepID=UPI001D03CAAA|nr:uncharacterized protein KY384_009153 [Bacidia gigantensis]KAG8525509.1 hypothetical protein KY384_009153 [Bacidia gigantensis]